MTKTCSRCGKVRPAEDFYVNKGSADGRRNDCKPCILRARAERYASDDAMRARIRARAAMVSATLRGEAGLLPRNCSQCAASMRPSRDGAPGVCVACKFRMGYKVRVSRSERLAIYERDGWICQICGRDVEPTLHPNHTFAATLDHITPRSVALFPDDSPENLRLAHRACNSARGARVS